MNHTKLGDSLTKYKGHKKWQIILKLKEKQFFFPQRQFGNTKRNILEPFDSGMALGSSLQVVK